MRLRTAGTQKVGYVVKWVHSRRIVAIYIVLAVFLALSGAELYSSASSFSYADLVTQLRAAGATVTAAPDSPGHFFTGTGHVIAVNGQHVEAYEYTLPLAADLDASRVSSDCATFHGFGSAVTVDWIAPPHCYKRGRVIAMYIGANAAMTHLLASALGAQFAGGTGGS